MKRFFLLLVLITTGCVGLSQPQPNRTNEISPDLRKGDTENLWTPTPGSTIMVKSPASTEWQLSPDGHIYYKESELYDGMFTINKEHPEWVEKYWEDTVRGLWNLNNIGENTAFVNQFPTDDSLVQYLKDGGGLVNNLCIPVIYLDSRRQYMNEATLIPTIKPIDLSIFALSIYKPTIDEIYKSSPSYETGTKYVSYLGAVAKTMTEEVEISGRNILKITFRRDLLVDATRLLIIDHADPDTNKEFLFPSMSDEKTPEENLLAATQLVRSWPITMQIKDTGWAYAIVPGHKPALVNFNTIWPIFGKYSDITKLEGSPISLR